MTKGLGLRYRGCMNSFDIIVIGAGIAGMSVAAQLSKTRKVVVVEMEDVAAYHTTGRSAASYEPNYGPPPMLALTRASADFFNKPPPGFADAALLTPRDSLFIEAQGQENHTANLLALASGLEEISIAAARQKFPVLREDYAKRVFLDAHTADMDVDLIYRGFQRQFKANGGALRLSAPVTSLRRVGKIWQAVAGDQNYSASIIVNAAGAWGDVVAAMAGVAAIGLVPKRRSIGVIPFVHAEPFADWPMVTDMGETWYAKPQSGKLIVSSADATPVEPHDAYADDMAIAEGVDRLMTATTIEVERLEHSWAGLRTFARDGNPVVGFDPSTEGFFWLVGQGGYGIQSCPSLSETAAHMVRGENIPAHIMDHGLDLNHITPERLR